MTANEILFDDLTAIRGIGPAREKWLRNTFDIHTYKEMAELTESEIEDKLKVEGKIISRQAIKSWLEQAKELIPNTGANIKPNEESVVEELTEKLNSTGHKNGWTPFATFLVYFQTQGKDQDRSTYQTLVHYMEEDHETNWPGIEVNQLTAWMLEQIGEIVDLSDTEVNQEREYSQGEEPTSKSRADIKIDQVRIYQPATAVKPAYQVSAGQSFKGKLTSKQPIRLAVDFGISGRIARDVAAQGISCLARCYEYESQTSSSALLSESLPTKLKKGKLKYTYEMPETSLPPGDYSIWVVVTTKRTDRLMPDFLELPKLTVM